MDIESGRVDLRDQRQVMLSTYPSLISGASIYFRPGTSLRKMKPDLPVAVRCLVSVIESRGGLFQPLGAALSSIVNLSTLIDTPP